MPVTKPNEGRDGTGAKGYTKYPAENAPVEKHGGNDAIHDGVETSGPPKTAGGGSLGNKGRQ